ncbi:MAG TPA: serine/threonine-protein kinase [Gemmatimonadaceae bacterium]|nr:serine/threonine-protein kinase [Gemmatimonadaceae bacterium]
MAALDRARWQSLEPLLDHALDLPPEERRQWLDTLSRESPTIAADLSSLLDSEADADERGFLSGTVVQPSFEGVVLGGWKIERPLGQGGMGTVWLASRSDGRSEEKAAVKVLNLAFLTERGTERFHREGSLLARLEHPGIARLLETGLSPSGQPYLVLELVDGKPIDAFADEHTLSLEARIRLFLQVLAAVEQAHAQLIIHRDLKPSNILVTTDGCVKLLDFGIAKILAAAPDSGTSSITIDSGRVLTPRYAAPEQIRGEQLGTATDVYALGVLLYLLVSGKHPTSDRARTPVESVQMLLQVEPPRLGLGDLDDILARSLRKVPADRYQTVAAFSEDLERFLRSHSVG